MTKIPSDDILEGFYKLRIRESEKLEIVGNGKPTGSVLKEAIVVSVTMLISVEK